MAYLYVQPKTSLRDISEQDLRKIVTRNEKIYGTCEHQINEIVEGLKAIGNLFVLDADARIFYSTKDAYAAYRSENLQDVTTVVICPGVYDICDLDTDTVARTIYGTRRCPTIIVNGVICRDPNELHFA
jgi:hypothetical protein